MLVYLRASQSLYDTFMGPVISVQDWVEPAQHNSPIQLRSDGSKDGLHEAKAGCQAGMLGARWF